MPQKKDVARPAQAGRLDPSQVKHLARRLETLHASGELAPLSSESLPHHKSLHLAARLAGYRDFNEVSRLLAGAAKEEQNAAPNTNAGHPLREAAKHLPLPGGAQLMSLLGKTPTMASWGGDWTLSSEPTEARKTETFLTAWGLNEALQGRRTFIELTRAAPDAELLSVLADICAAQDVPLHLLAPPQKGSILPGHLPVMEAMFPWGQTFPQQARSESSENQGGNFYRHLRDTLMDACLQVVRQQHPESPEKSSAAHHLDILRESRRAIAERDSAFMASVDEMSRRQGGENVISIHPSTPLGLTAELLNVFDRWIPSPEATLLLPEQALERGLTVLLLPNNVFLREWVSQAKATLTSQTDALLSEAFPVPAPEMTGQTDRMRRLTLLPGHLKRTPRMWI